MKNLILLIGVILSFNIFAESKLAEQQRINEKYSKLSNKYFERIKSIDKNDTDTLILTHYDFIYELKRDVYYSQRVVGMTPIKLISKSELEEQLRNDQISNKAKKEILTNLKLLKTHIGLLVENDLILEHTFLPVEAMINIKRACESAFCESAAVLTTGFAFLLSSAISSPFLPNQLISRNHIANAEAKIENTLREEIPDLKEKTSHEIFIEMTYGRKTIAN